MPKKHIVQIGYRRFAADSVTAATKAVEALSKMTPVDYDYDGETSRRIWKPVEEADRRSEYEISLEMNQEVQFPAKPKPSKAKSLPAPKRGSILCNCEKSYVAPRESCPHCGRPFSESHNRTHDGSADSPKLRLL